ncbi:MAG: major facilitator superfamily 1 [Gemmatimonadetes bacterium]|nr:major facilitator superfamily 1 [Gemmatimonadota bacterium]
MTLDPTLAAPPHDIAASTPDDAALERAAMGKVTRRLIPFLFVLYIFNYLDRTNLGIAALEMNRDLGLSAAVYGLGAGMFYLGYILFEIPSNLLLARVGARWWIARIMVTWGLLASAMMFVRSPYTFYLVRFLLGVAEAGFFPGIIFYLSRWFPAEQRARAISRFMIAVPLSMVVGGPLGGALLGLSGHGGLKGWQWLFLIEGIPSVLLGFGVLAYMTERPEDAGWLTPAEREWLAERVRRGQEGGGIGHLSPGKALANGAVWRIALLYVLGVIGGLAYIFWAPGMIRDLLHLSDFGTGSVFGGIALLSAAAMLAVGHHSDRTGERWMHVGGSALLVAIGCAGAALLRNPYLVVASLALVQIGAMTFLPPFWSIPSTVLTGSTAAATIALINSIGNIGGFVGPNLLGFVKSATGGFTGALLTLSGMSLVSAALAVALRRSPAWRRSA